MVISFDTETCLFTVGLMATPLVCLSWCDGTQTGLLDRADGLVWFHNQLTQTANHLVGQNTAYDLCVLAAEDATLIPLIFDALDNGRFGDTKLREQLLAIADGYFDLQRYSLKDLASKHLGLDMDKGAIRTSFASMRGKPISEWPVEYQTYARDDATITRLVWVKQEQYRQSDKWDDLLANEPSQVRASVALQLATCWGMRTEPEQVAKVKAGLYADKEVQDKKLQALGVVRANGTRDMSVIKDMVTKAYGGNPPNTPAGGVATSKQVLLDSGDPLLEDIAEGGKAAKYISTYLPWLERGLNAPINPGYSTLKVTSRTGSSNPNVQNFPVKGGIRECFIPRAGFVFVDADYSTLELRTLAQSCIDLLGFSHMAEALVDEANNGGADLHSLLAGRIFNEDPVAIFEAYKAGDKEAGEKRKLAKCFHPDVEVLTKYGWHKVSTLTYGTEIMCATPGVDAVNLHWAAPTQLTTRVGDLVELKNESISLRVTPDHRMLVFNNKGTPHDTTPTDFNSARKWASAGVLDDGAGVEENLMRLVVATQADGSYSGRKIRFGFTKQRKIDRMRKLLRGLDYKEAIHKNGKNPDVTAFALAPELSDSVKHWLTEDKLLSWELLHTSLATRITILDEAEYWDSTTIKGKNSYLYSSTPRQNIEVLQAIASISGCKTKVIKEDVGASHVLSVKNRLFTRGGNVTCEPYETNVDVYCVTVPSSYILVRDRGTVTITGQCGNFGLPGGMGVPTFIKWAKTAYKVDISIERGHALKRAYLDQWPEIPAFFKAIGGIVDATGGGAIRIPRSQRVHGGKWFTEMCNLMFQAPAADGAKAALYETSRRCYTVKTSALYGCRVVAFIHDEILIEAPRESAELAMQELKTVMIEQMKIHACPDIPVAVDAGISERWGE